MPLMERVITLLRANLNDLLDRAEDPEITVRQLVRDMENQLLQVKTRVAIALADRHLLEARAREERDAVVDWQAKAERALSLGEEALARAAQERAQSHELTLAACNAQLVDGTAEAEALRASYTKLERKLAETRSRCETVVAQHRRAQLAATAAGAQLSVAEDCSPAPARSYGRNAAVRVSAHQAACRSSTL